MRLSAKVILILNIVFLAGYTCLYSEEPAQRIEHQPGLKNFGNIAYPASNCINLEQGTFEIRFKPEFDPNHIPAAKYETPMNYMRLSDKGKTIFCIRTLNRKNKQAKQSNSLHIYGSLIKPHSIKVPQKTLNLEKGKWINLTITWKYDHNELHIKIYSNGKLIHEDTRSSDRPQVTDKATFYIGGHDYSYATVDSIRVSSVARTTAEIAKSAKSGYTLDSNTLLLDQFDNILDTFTGPAKGPRGKLRGYFVCKNSTIELFRKQRD